VVVVAVGGFVVRVGGIKPIVKLNFALAGIAIRKQAREVVVAADHRMDR
jgi:hypothetical protein